MAAKSWGFADVSLREPNAFCERACASTDHDVIGQGPAGEDRKAMVFADGQEADRASEATHAERLTRTRLIDDLNCGIASYSTQGASP